MATSASAELRGSPGVDPALFDEFQRLLRSFSDEKLISLTRPLLQAPSISVYLERNTRIRELANNDWVKVYKPQLVIELRLLHLTSITEAALKPLINMIEVYIRDAESAPSRNPTKLGDAVKYIHPRTGSLVLFPLLQIIFQEIIRFHEIRNAVSHSKYLFEIVFEEVLESEFLKSVGVAADTPFKKAISEFISSMTKPKRDKFLEFAGKMGTAMGLKPESDYTKVLECNKSVIVYSGKQSNDWIPIDNTSSQMSFAELTKLLNEMDRLVSTGLASVMGEVDERRNNNKIVDQKCKSCAAYNWTTSANRSYTCWYCQTPN